MSSPSNGVLVGVIGGSGLYHLDNLTLVETVNPETPWGFPSSPITICSLPSGTKIAFLARHGKGHIISPTNVPSRANISALKSLGVKAILAFSAVGSLREEIAPGDFILPSQVIDRTKGVRPVSFFEGTSIVAHATFGDPFSNKLVAWLESRVRQVLEEEDRGVKLHTNKTIICMEGPQFSTRAESIMYRGWGADLINMSVLPESKLAREAELGYALIATATDYDSWRPHTEAVTAAEVFKTLQSNAHTSRHVAAKILEDLHDAASKGDILTEAVGSMGSSIMPRSEGQKEEDIRKLSYVLPELSHKYAHSSRSMASVLDSTTTTTNNLIGSPEPPRLSLVIDKPPSSSPFPSPSSSFLPPPRPGAHEFASKPPASARFSRKKSVLKEDVLDDQPDQQPQRDTMTDKNTNEPRTSLAPTPTRDSTLVSSRPAPPSPVISRRTSTALSQRSTSSGSEVARIPSPSNPKRLSRLNQEVKFETSSIEPQQTTTEPQRSLLVKIRDFAFPTTDARFSGRGPDVPRANRHNRTGSDVSSDDDSDSDGRRNSGWGGFSWSGFTNRLSWTSFGSGRHQSSEGAELPSKTDFARNFDVSSPTEEKGAFSYDGADEDDDDGNYDAEEDEEEDGSPLVPGRYRALYAFEPEGTAEMALEEDQVVSVICRGGGVGWAVVEKEDGGHALVPESYLEFVEASREH